MVPYPLLVDAAVEQVHRTEWSRIVATLIRQIHDFELAEDAAQEAFASAVDVWRRTGIPDSPRAWIIQTARHKAIDAIRRRERLRQIVDALPTPTLEEAEPGTIVDDQLRLICTCCHPALAVEAQVALTLRELGGLSTEEIARAFLVPEATMAQRLVRAKRKIRDAGIPFVVPETHEMPERLDAILAVLYLIFNEGYAASGGDELLKVDLCEEAIRLARLVRSILPAPIPGEATALLALMLLHDSRRKARASDAGELIILEEQNRKDWNQAQIQEALPLVEEALRQSAGPYGIQAAIAALHCQAPSADVTDWRQIAQLYGLLESMQPSPIVTLNRAVAVGMAGDHADALLIVDALEGEGRLDDYHRLHATRADLLRRSGQAEEAAAAYRRAAELAENAAERRFLERRLAELSA